MKPMLRDVLWLLGLQLGAGIVMAGILEVLPIAGGSWVSGIAVMVGSQTFAFIKEKKQPGTFAAPGYCHRLALGATVGQLAAATLFVGLAALVSYDEMEATGAELGWWVVVIVVVAAALSYGLTRWGLALMLRNLARGKASTVTK